jgi:hypothetical protein
MKVYITSTPEFSSELVKKVVEILNKTPGELEFISDRSLTINQYSLAHPPMRTIDKIKFLSFDELFDLCDTYRTFREIPDDAFVVLVTSIKNRKDWFSAFRGKNIFIHGEEWEYYTKRDGKYGIAYQVLENIFQSMIDLNINDVDNEPNIHIPSIGCINDMCMDKIDVMLKLRTADICESCIARAEEKPMDPLVLDHIQASIENLREAFVNSNRIKSKVKPLAVYIDPKRNVKIGDKDIHIIPLRRVLFIFFLKNPQGIKTKYLSEYQDDLYEVYKEVRKSAEKSRIKRMVDDKKGGDPSFDSIKSKLNKDLYKKLGSNLADYYMITKVEIKDGMNIYKINLEKNYITIAPTR